VVVAHPVQQYRFGFTSTTLRVLSPDTPHLRSDKCDHNTHHMLQIVLLPYLDTGLPRNYFADGITGQYFVLRDGTLFVFKPLAEKALYREPPKRFDGASGTTSFPSIVWHMGSRSSPIFYSKRTLGEIGDFCARLSAVLAATAGLPPVPASLAVVPDLPLRLAEYTDICSLSV
jgi:hypothetical protein